MGRSRLDPPKNTLYEGLNLNTLRGLVRLSDD